MNKDAKELLKPLYTNQNKSALISIKPITQALTNRKQGPLNKSNRISRHPLTILQHRKLNSYTPGFSFSKLSRFNPSIYEKFNQLSPLFKSTLSQSKDSLKEKIISNKNMKPYSPFQKSIRLKAIIMQEDSHREIIKFKKECLVRVTRQEKQNKLLDKFRKFEIRQKKSEAILAKKAWIVLEIAVGYCFIASSSIFNRKCLKARVEKRIKWLQIVAKCLGKLKLKLKILKKRRSIKILSNSVIHFKAWMKRLKNSRAIIIAELCESLQERNALFRIMLIWNFRVLRVQRILKQALIDRRKLYKYLLIEWAECEHKLFTEKSKMTKVSKPEKKKSRIPDDVKIKYISKKIKEIVQNYIVKVKNYSVVKEQYNESIKDLRRHQSVILEFNPIKPPSLNLREEFDENVFENMIHLAVRERLNWRKSILIVKT